MPGRRQRSQDNELVLQGRGLLDIAEGGGGGADIMPSPRYSVDVGAAMHGTPSPNNMRRNTYHGFSFHGPTVAPSDGIV